MKNILLSLILFGTISSFANESLKVDPSAQAKADKQMKIQNRNVIKHVVKELLSNLPQRIDNYTTFTEISSDDLTLNYTFEINTGSKSDEAVIKEDKPRMTPYIKEGICQSSKRFLQSDINIKYIYKSAPTKKELFSFYVEAKDCLKFWK